MRIYKNRIYTPEADMVHLFASAIIGASGAVSSASGKNIKAITKLVADGQYEIELSEKYFKLLDVQSAVVASAESAVFKIEVLEAPASLQSDFRADRKFKIQCYDAAGAAVNPISGAEIKLHILVKRSSVDR